jgi:hypothetical protein
MIYLAADKSEEKLIKAQKATPPDVHENAGGACFTAHNIAHAS